VIRAVIDTNVLVSGLISPRGNEALVLLAVHQRLVRPCLSEEIIAEYAEVLARPKFAFPAEEIVALIDMLRRNGEVFEPPSVPPVSPDPADSKFLACAEAAAADFIITGNRRHFPPSGLGRTRIVSGGEILEWITREI